MKREITNTIQEDNFYKQIECFICINTKIVGNMTNVCSLIISSELKLKFNTQTTIYPVVMGDLNWFVWVILKLDDHTDDTIKLLNTSDELTDNNIKVTKKYNKLNDN